MATEGLRKRSGEALDVGSNGSLNGKMQKEKAPRQTGDIKHGALEQALRIAALAFYFLASCVSIHTTQLLGLWLYFYNQQWYYTWMAVTKQQFTLLLMTMQKWWAPIKVRVSWDSSLQGEFKQTADGRLETDFPERIVLIANHQIYTDWLYLWWIAYTSSMHGHIFIILKESLKRLPMFGVAMQLFSFIFMSRKWEKDQPRMAHRLQKLSKKHTRVTASGKLEEYLNPMWLLIFPEGTNLSNNGRRKSKQWAEKQGIEDSKHQLLPRSTGLQFCLKELAGTLDYVYDCTVAYDGVPRGEYAQDIFTLYGMYFQGRRPPSVDFYWRRFKVSEIPYEDPEKFSAWLLERWREKDELLEQYLVTGRFPAADHIEEKTLPNGLKADVKKRGAGYIETEVRTKYAAEVLQIYIPWVSLALLVNVFYKFWRMFSTSR